jgi:hypothetical protein
MMSEAQSMSAADAHTRFPTHSRKTKAAISVVSMASVLSSREATEAGVFDNP